MEETWYDIENFEGPYQYSNLLRVRRVGGAIKTRNGKLVTYRSRIMKVSFDTRGYAFISLRNMGVQKVIKMHLLFARKFIPNPENKPCVNHINGNKSDYSLSNLEWATRSEDRKHAYRLGLSKSGSEHQRARIILDLQTGIYYGTINEASEAKNIKTYNLRNYLRGVCKNKTSLVYA